MLHAVNAFCVVGRCPPYSSSSCYGYAEKSPEVDAFATSETVKAVNVKVVAVPTPAKVKVVMSPCLETAPKRVATFC